MNFTNRLKNMASSPTPSTGDQGENTRLLSSRNQAGGSSISSSQLYSRPSETAPYPTTTNTGYSRASRSAPGSPMTPGSGDNSPSVNNGGVGNNDGYEELFKDSVPCPSCRGLGRVPKELENQLVALIPMKDGRLKPRRTTLYVAIAVGLCVVTASLLIFFLMPRDITISSNRPFLQPRHIDINVTAKFANFTVINHYNVSNNNFYSVKISGVSMKSLYSNAVIAQSFAYKEHPLEISARSDGELSVPMDFILSGEHGSLVSHCMSNWSWIHNLPILFEVTANYTYMGHSEQATLTTFQTVSCHPAPKPPPPSTHKPPTTRHITTTTTTGAPKRAVRSALRRSNARSVGRAVRSARSTSRYSKAKRAIDILLQPAR